MPSMCSVTISKREWTSQMPWDLTHLPLNKMATILADDILKCTFLNENDRIPIQISLMFVPRSPIDNTAALVHVMAWRRIGDKPLPESMTHICGTGGTWVISLSGTKSYHESHETPKPRNIGLESSDRPQIWQALRQLFCWSTHPIQSDMVIPIILIYPISQLLFTDMV